MSENRYAEWSIADVYWKADSEGGIANLIEWGGPGVLTALGEPAVQAAWDIVRALDVIRGIFDDHTPELEDYEW